MGIVTINEDFNWWQTFIVTDGFLFKKDHSYHDGKRQTERKEVMKTKREK